MKSSSNQQAWHDPPEAPSGNTKTLQDNVTNECFCPLFNNATFLMLEREESLLGEIVLECNELMDIAREQAEEVADDIEYRL